MPKVNRIYGIPNVQIRGDITVLGPDEPRAKERRKTPKETIIRNPKISKTKTNDIESITFEVDDVERSKEAPSNRVPAEQAVRKQFPKKSKVEAWSQTMKSTGKTDLLQYDGNCLIGTIGQCFAEHRSLVLSPDMIWLTILQGFANHINLDPEKYRGKFVNFEGKEKLIVRRDDFLKGCRENTWEEVFPAFTDQIKGYIGDNYDMIMADFSTTTELEKAAYEVTMMDVVQSYFSYEFRTMCGIPEITIEGSKEDWKTLYNKAEKLGEFNLGWWMLHLLPTLEKFVKTVNGEIDNEFWHSLFKESGGSGGPYITGQILNLFPYLEGYDDDNKKTKIKNEYFDWESKNNCFGMYGANYDEFPSGLSNAPFVWKYFPNGMKYDMRFYAGFFGSKQNMETKSLKPVIGWGITEEGSKPMTEEEMGEMVRDAYGNEGDK